MFESDVIFMKKCDKKLTELYDTTVDKKKVCMNVSPDENIRDE